MCQMIGPYEIEIVCRSVILGNFAELAALEKSYRQVEARRTILAFVVTVWEKIEDRRRQPGVTKRVDHRPIDLGIAASALLVGRAAAVSDHGDDKPVLDALAIVLVAREPCDCTDRTRSKQESVAVSRPQAGHPLGKMCEQRDARAVVVGERGMAHVGRK